MSRHESLKRRRALAVRLLEEGLTETVIAERTGLSSRTIRRLRKAKVRSTSTPPVTM